MWTPARGARAAGLTQEPMWKAPKFLTSGPAFSSPANGPQLIKTLSCHKLIVLGDQRTLFKASTCKKQSKFLYLVLTKALIYVSHSYSTGKKLFSIKLTKDIKMEKYK